MGKYTGISCEYCHKIFTEQDDVVVCPECGAPHHRECYKELGQCALTDKHSPDFAWKPQAKETTENNAGAVTFCQHCNTVNPFGAKYCVMCGTPLSENYQGREGRYSRNTNNNNDASAFYKDEQHHTGEYSIDGVTSSELTAYTGESFHYFSRNFKRIISGHNFSWNWSAFIFSYFYFFYRKMYKIGFMLLALRLFAFVPAILCYIVEPDTSTQMLGATVLYNAALTQKLYPINSFLNVVVNASHAFAAITANKFFLKCAVNDIKAYKESSYAAHGSSQYYDDIYRLGKPNIFSVILIIIAMFFFYGYIGTLFNITYN